LGIIKWRLLVDNQSPGVSFAVLSESFFKSLFLGAVTPGRLGELWKAKYLADKSSISLGRSFFTVIADRLIDIFIITVVGIAGIIFLIPNKREMQWTIIILFFILIFTAVYFVFKKEKIQKISRFLFNLFIPNYFKNKIGRTLSALLKAGKSLPVID
jgi:uncharacterized protein (TIRG00374 family)